MIPDTMRTAIAEGLARLGLCPILHWRKRGTPEICRTSAALCAAGLLLAIETSATAQGYLSEERARLKAATILKGNPYGETNKAAATRIQKAQLVTAGVTDCGSEPVTRPVWQFHVIVPKDVVSYGNEPIDGYLVIDARSGKLVCASLPFLD